MRFLVLAILAIALLPANASAHDDPIVTVRVMCNGFNVLDMDAVLGEISDSATLSVDRPVHGTDQIEAWVQEQMDKDLRIEITDIGTPQPLPDGYTLSWTARLTRQDWRQAGIAARQATNTVVIHNGRITEWSATLSTSQSPVSQQAADSAGIVVAEDPPGSAIPELFGIPLTLLVAAAALVAAGTLMVRRLLH
jgi:hypothetical protein